MNEFLPVVVPFFGAAVFLSWAVTCCAARRTSRIIYGLQSRVEALELQRTQQQQQPPVYQPVPVVQTVPYPFHQQQQQQPPPYNAAANRVMAYYIPPPLAQQQQQPRPSAPV